MYSDDQIIEKALAILAKRIKKEDFTLSSPSAVKTYLQVKLGELEHEVFGVLFLNVKNRLIEDAIMFTGSLTHASVYPREVVKKALYVNAASAVVYHNHPSGDSKPSQADISLTKTLSQALQLIDVKILDHIVVTATETTSFAENGMI